MIEKEAFEIFQSSQKISIGKEQRIVTVTFLNISKNILQKVI